VTETPWVGLSALSAPDGRVATELELVIVAIDGKGGAARPLTEAERTALSS